MKFRQNGISLTHGYDVLATLPPDVTGKVVLLIHGLCMNDLQWRTTRADGSKHDHGAALERDLGFTPVYLRYNSGLHVSTNGRALSEMLEEFVAAWPSPITQLVIVAHSMGGLVTRSAFHYASEVGHSWRRRLKKIVFLGTPHHGAPLERGGHWIDMILGATPYAKPFAKLGKIRSSGITDLRHGSLFDEDWQGKDRFAREAATPHALPLPDGVKCFAIGATTGSASGDLKDKFLGDGLVPLSSALGQHEDPSFTLQFPPKNQTTLYETNHMQLLSAEPAYETIRAFLA
jgi:pimeloyl-ACP methyl ester carboxylesterase